MTMRIGKWVLGRIGSLVTFLALGVVITLTWDYPQPRPSVSWEEVHDPDRGWPSNGEIPTRLAFSPDSQILLTNNHVARLREVASGRIVAELANAADGEDNVLPNIALQFPKFFDDGRLLVAQVGGRRMSSVPTPASLKIWEVATGRELATFNDIGLARTTPSFVLSNNGKALAFHLIRPRNSSERGDRIRVWTPSDGLMSQVFLPTDYKPFVLSPDGKSLLGITQEKTMAITRWDVALGRSVASIPLEGWFAPKEMFFAPDGRLFLLYHGKSPSMLLDLATGIRQELPPHVTTYLLSPTRFAEGGKALLLGDLRTSDQSLRIYDFATDRLLDVSHAGYSAISGDGRRLSSVQSTAPQYRTFPRALENDFDSTVIVTDQPSGQERARFVATGVRNTWLSPDGRRIAATETRNIITRANPIWNLLPFGLGNRMSDRNQDVSYVSTLTVWDVESRRNIATVPFGDRMIQAVQTAFSADGKKLAIEYPISLKRGEPGRWVTEIWDLPENRFFWPRIGLCSGLAIIALVVGRFFDAVVRRVLAAYRESGARRNSPGLEPNPE